MAPGHAETNHGPSRRSLPITPGWPEARRRIATGARVLLTAIVLALTAVSWTGCATGAAESMRFDLAAGAEGVVEPAPAAESAEAAPRELASDTAIAPRNPSATERLPAERLRVYSADLTISVGRVQTARRELMSLAEQLGGYVESSSEDSVTIRIPAADFDTALTRVETLGTVEERSVRTVDVTDQFTDLERRLEVAERSRARLQELLERAQEAEERVAILREIRRLTEEIETLRSSLASLGDLIRYSRITVRLVSRLAGRSPARIPFPWIAGLDPLHATTGRLDRPVDVDLGDEFAVFESGRKLRAETAAGTRVRIGAVENEPMGDTEFWAEALRAHLAPRFVDFSAVAAGELRGALFVGAGSYRYLVLVAVRGEEVVVAEAFIPDAADEGDRVQELLGVFEEVSL